MGLPCAFTKKLRVGDSFVVCSHVFAENLQGGSLLSARVGIFTRHAHPQVVNYGGGQTSAINVDIYCNARCAKSSPDMVQLMWNGGKIELAPLADPRL